MEHKIATAERKVLVQLVKLVQKRGMEGEKGGWKEFLNTHDKKIGSSLSDPSRRANDVLIAFLMTFKKKEDVQLIARVLQLDANRDLIEKFKEESPDKETPEQRLVRMTIGHYLYPTEYSFPSHAEDWFVSEMGKKKSKMMKSTRMVAIDCEMVLCEDGSEAVVRVGAVDRDLNVILDKYVKPDKPVADYRTDITGVTAEDIERATLSVADIQKKLRRFLSKGTILVGHSLNKDLSVLKIDHARVIDTAMVFRYSSATNLAKPSLNYLCKLVLGHEVRKDDTAHNCVHDAAAAMKIVLAVVEKGVDTSIPESEEVLEAQKNKLEAEKKQLFLHKIPDHVRSQELHEVVNGDFTVDVKPPKRLGGGFYGAVITFDSPEDANQAFENIDGKLTKDKGGLSQKLVTFKFSSGSEAELYIRKMVQDGESSATLRPRTDDSEGTRDANVNPGIEEMLESEKTRLENENLKLFLHKIPHNVSSQELRGVVTGNFTLDTMPPKRQGGYYSAVAIFSNPEEANQAFENVNGELVKDRMGLPQKLAKFKLSSGAGADLYVRKMVRDGENSGTKRANTEENNASSKRQKREGDSEETREANANPRSKDSACEDHVKEIEELKQKLKAKDSVKSSDDHLKEIEELKQKLKAREFEIKAQDKIIENLKKKLERKAK